MPLHARLDRRQPWMSSPLAACAYELRKANNGGKKMCFGSIVSDKEDSVVTAPPLDKTPLMTTPRVFRSRIGNIYVVTNHEVFLIGVHDEATDDINSGDRTLSELVNNDAYTELTEPAPAVVAPVVTAEEALADRLKAAEGSTGFKLHDIVRDVDSGTLGDVIGFGRVNDPDGTVERVLLVDYGLDAEIIAVHPGNLDFAGRLTA